MRNLVLIIALLIAGASTCYGAGFAQALRNDLAPLAGQVIAVRTDDCLIDLDAAAGVRNGDLFAVLKAGDRVVDPGSGKVLGRQETVAAVLRVTQVLRGYSKALPMGESAGGIRQGDAVRRYALMQATFWDYTDQGEGLYTEVREALPDLQWRDYAPTQRQRPAQPAFTGAGQELFFILRPGAIEVRDGEGRLIKAYHTAMPAIPVTDGVTADVPAQSETVGTLPLPVRICDFVHDGVHDLAAITDGKAVHVFEVGTDPSRGAVWTPETPDRILTLRWWRPASQEPLYLATTLWSERGPRGELLRLKDNQLTLAATVRSSLLGTFDRDADGVPETLLTQEFDQKSFFGRRIKLMRLADGRLQAEPLDMALPDGFTVTGSALVDLTADGQPEIVMIKDGFLFIYQGRELLYKSPRQSGGSIASLTFNTTPHMKDFRLDTVRFEIGPLWYDIDGDGAAELVIPASKGLNRALPGLANEVDQSWLAVVRGEQGRYVTRSLSEIFEQPIQGLGISPAGILFLTTAEPSGENEAGRGTIHRLQTRHP